MRRTVFTALTILFSGCAQDTVDFEFGFADATKFAVFMTYGCGLAGRAVAQVDREFALRFPLENCDTLNLSVLEFSKDISSVCLAPGEIFPVADGVVLPEANMTTHLQRSNDTLEALSNPGAGYEDVRERPYVGLLDLAQCTNQQLCVSNEPSCVCSEPCNPPERRDVAPPEMPTTECSSGWHLTPVGRGRMACQPFDGDALPECPDDAYFVPGRGCVSLAANCAGGPWPTVKAGALYVDGASAVGGDGSIARPFNTIADAIQVGSSTVIAVTSGDYELPSDLGATDIQIVGACASGANEVRIAINAATQVRAAAVLIHGARIDTANNGSLQVAAEGALILTEVDVAGSVSIDVLGSLEVERSRLGAAEVQSTGMVVIRDSEVGAALVSEDAATLEMSTTALLGPSARIRATTGSLISLTDVAIATPQRAVVINQSLMQATGIWFDGAEAIFARSSMTQIDHAFVRTSSTGLSFNEAAANGDCPADQTERTNLSDITLVADGAYAVRVQCHPLHANRVVTLGSPAYGLLAIGAELSLNDVAIYDARKYGISATTGGSINLDRAQVHDVGEVGIFVGTRVDGIGPDYRFAVLSHVDVADVEGVGIVLNRVPTAIVSDATIQRTKGVGLAVWDEGTGSDSTINGVRIVGVGEADRGLDFCRTGTRARCDGSGIVVDGGENTQKATTLTLQDAILDDTRVYGMQLRHVTALMMHRVEIANTQTGLRSVAVTIPDADYFRDTRFDNVEIGIAIE